MDLDLVDQLLLPEVAACLPVGPGCLRTSCGKDLRASGCERLLHVWIDSFYLRYNSHTFPPAQSSINHESILRFPHLWSQQLVTKDKDLQNPTVISRQKPTSVDSSSWMETG